MLVIVVRNLSLLLHFLVGYNVIGHFPHDQTLEAQTMVLLKDVRHIPNQCPHLLVLHLTNPTFLATLIDPCQFQEDHHVVHPFMVFVVTSAFQDFQICFAEEISIVVVISVFVEISIILMANRQTFDEMVTQLVYLIQRILKAHWKEQHLQKVQSQSLLFNFQD